MEARLEVWPRAGSPRAIPLSKDRMSIGREMSDIVIDDELVSALHAVLDPVGAGWCIRDLGSTNGTYVNGKRILSECALRSNDEIRIGRTRMVFLSGSAEEMARGRTKIEELPPRLTTAEREVLRELCRPVLTGSTFTEPASTRAISKALVISEAAVKAHLHRLYAKLGLYGEDRRRPRLANEAIERGAVNIADLRGSERDTHT